MSSRPERIRLGVSACLLGERVRYDGGHKLDTFLTDVLGPHVEWIPVCPEVEVGLGVPRPALRLVGRPEAPALIVERTGKDLTSRMQRYAEKRAHELARLDLDGYVLKRSSPSCGLFRVKVYGENRMAGATGRGIFAAELVQRCPMLPVEEEGRLNDAAIRENFIERVFASARWRAFLAGGPRGADLLDFHAAQKLTVLSHSPRRYQELGRMVAGTRRTPSRQELAAYGHALMEAIAIPASRARHVNVLQHLAGFFKRALTDDERAELGEVIEEYRRGLVPLIVPITLVKHHVRRLHVEYLAQQTYLSPHPIELMLRNHV